MRPIIPTTLAELPKLEELSSGLGARHDYYIKEIDTLEKWKSADLGSARVWCPLNSFNIPSQSCVPNSWLCLQGAGDLLMMGAFLSPRSSAALVTTYAKFVEILANLTVNTVMVDMLNPSDLDMQRLGREHEYTIHHPLAVRPLLLSAIKSGWDHFDWMGLMLGLKNRDSRPTFWFRDFDLLRAMTVLRYNPPGTYKIGLHLTASTAERSALNILQPLLQMADPDWHFLLLGGNELRKLPSLPPNVSNLGGTLSYHETAAVTNLCHAVVAVDSIVLHLANLSAESTPILGIYTDTPATWAGYRSRYCETMEANGVDNINIMEVYLWMKRKLETRIR